MKREKDIYTRIIAKDNIQRAIIHASKRKKTRGNVIRVLENLDYCISLIEDMLKNKSYKPNPYERVVIMDGVRKKERVIFKPRFFPDQCIHWALMLQLEPILKRGMYDYCCASIKNRGILYGARYLKKILVRDRKNTKYALKLDVKKFYPNVDKEILKRKFRKIIKDRDTLDLIDLIIESSEERITYSVIILLNGLQIFTCRI
ncbi:MAG: hypothetical protein IJ272_05705 [Clostridia bacterium]|nr:hypothetical protein [Clostridia bacterium]